MSEESQKSLSELRKEKLIKMKTVQAYDRAMDLEAGITIKLNNLLSEYFDKFFVFPEDNDVRYNKLNKAWKYYCYNINRFNKKVPLRLDAFEIEVTQIIEKNPQFKYNKI